jgi:sensor histidine kinase YesM
MNKTEQRICVYSSVLIALVMNSPKLMALRANGVIARYWHFNIAELLTQILINAAFCYLLFYANLRPGRALAKHREKGRYFVYLLLNFILIFFSWLTGGILQRRIFMFSQPKGVYWSGYMGRFVLSTLFVAIIIKIVLLLREGIAKDRENSRLKTAYLEAELQLLKEQVNPHFLFNSLSSLSGIIREDPVKAQAFVSHLSKILRYALNHNDYHLVTLEEELAMARSYGQLLKLRFEEAFLLNVDVDPAYLKIKLPHLSLQPLIENAAKHNKVTLADPLRVDIFVSDGSLEVRNNLRPITAPETSTGTGLKNLGGRYRILMDKEIETEKTVNTFTVKLPLVQ